MRQVAWNWQLTSWWIWRKRVEIRKTNTLWPGENVSFQGEIEASNWSAEKYFSCHDARTPLKCKGIQDCLGFQIPCNRFQIPRTQFQSLLVGLGFRTPIVSEIPNSKVHDSGFHRQNFSGFRIPRAKLLGFRNPRAKLLGFRIPRAKLLGFRIPRATFSDSVIQGAICSCGYTKGLGTTELTYGTCRHHVTRLQPGSPQMTAHVDLQHFLPNHVHTHEIRPGVRCRLRNGVIGSCVESSKEKVDLRLLLCLQRQCTPVTASSQTSSFLEPRIFISLKSHKPVCKTYRPENSIYFHITTFSKIQLVVYYQCCVLIGWATTMLYVIAH